MKSNKLRKLDDYKAYLYIFPAFLVVVTFVIYPMIRSVYMSFFTEYNIFKHTGSGFGLNNFISVINDDKFILSLVNTLKYTVVVVPVSIAISLFLAVLLNTRLKGWKLFQSLYFIPYITNVIAIGLAFQFIFHSEYGVLNLLFKFIGLQPIQWLNDVRYSIPALIIFGVWSGLAFKIVVFMAGLQSIDKQYHEAARVDGANGWNIFWKITLPMLTPVVTYVSIVSVIGSLKTYVEVVGLFRNGAGTANSAMTIVYYVYDKFYNANKHTIAAAAAVILFAIILVITLIQQKVINKDRYGEN